MSESTLIHAGRLIDVEREEVVHDRVIVVEGDRITDVVTVCRSADAASTLLLFQARGCVFTSAEVSTKGSLKCVPSW